MVIAEVNGYYLTECYQNDGSILRSWVSTSNIQMD